MHLHFKHVVATGSASKRVTCEQCGHAYEYSITRKAALDTVPLPFLIDSARRICGERLAKRLAEDVEPVPCPACAWLQSAMVPELMRRFLGPIRTVVGAYCVVSCAALAIPCAATGVWFALNPKGPDVNWWGLAAVGAAGCAFGSLLIAARIGLAKLRYRALVQRASLNTT